MSVVLSDITIVTIDCVAHSLTQRALEDTLRVISPAHILIYSNDATILPQNREGSLTYLPCECKSLDQVAEILWYNASPRIKTSHMLVIQYDGWVTNVNAWNSQFLKYDYIGAPWPWEKVNSVGNGGFSLRSTRLMQYLESSEGRANFPLIPGEPEDVTLCQRYREFLELDGFRWAPKDVASAFSTERAGDPTSSFGFHGTFNFKKVLDAERLAERRQLASPYVRSTVAWQELRNQKASTEAAA